MANSRYNTEYLYGSEAPKRQYDEPVRRRRAPLTKEEQRKQQAARYVEENRRKAARFGGLYTFFITCAVGVMLFICVNYISTYNNKTATTKSITKMQSELEALKEENDVRQLAIDTSIDYDYIYDVATKELGMVYVSPDHVKEYKSGESEYIIQYSDNPEK